MLLLSSLILLAVGHGGAEPWHTLTCPLQKEHQGLRMVWCRWTSSDCCTGLSFSPEEDLLAGGGLRVIHRQDSFAVELLEPQQREGLYWCGRLRANGTIIRLAQRHIFGSFGSYLWSMARWTLLPLLVLIAILLNHIYSRNAAEIIRKRAENRHDPSARRMNPRTKRIASEL